MVDINSALALKYRILGQQADAQTMQANAMAGEAAERTRLMSGNAYAEQALRHAQAMQATEAAKMVAPLGQSEIGMRNMQTNMMPQQVASEIGLRDAQTMAIPLAFPQGQQPANPARPGMGMGMSVNPGVRPVGNMGGGSGYNANPTGYAGSSNYTDLTKPHLATGGMVKGPGDGTVDTVDAKLANGEAVLNKGAAEHVGRPVIDALNFIGQMKMGMVPGNSGAKPTKGKKDSGNSAAEVPGYANGVSFAQGFGGKSAAAPSSNQESNSGYAAALQAQNPNSVANTVADVRAKLTGGQTSVPRVVPGFAEGTSWVDNANAAVDAAAARNGQAVQQPMPSNPKPGYAKGTSKAAPPKKGDAPAKNDKAPAKGGGKEKVVQPPQPQIDPHALMAALHIGGMGAPGQSGGPAPGMGMI